MEMDSEKKPHILVFHVARGVPSALIEQAFAQLPHLRELRDTSTFFPRMACTHAEPATSFLHAFSTCQLWGEEEGTLPHRTLLEALGAHGYSTELCTDSADPRLEAWRLHDPDAPPARDTTSCAARDEAVLARAMDRLQQWLPEGPPRALLLSCSGCSGAQAVHGRQQEGDLYQSTSDMSLYLPLSVVQDDARTPGSRAHQVPECRKAARRFFGENPANGTLVSMALSAHNAAWAHLVQLDGQVGRVVTLLRRAGCLQRTAVVLLATQGSGILEHGSVCGMPWESNLRTFALVKRANQLHGERRDHPVSLAHLGGICLWCCGLPDTWRGLRTTGLPPADLPAGALDFRHPRRNCMRVKLLFDNSWHSVAYWFPAEDPEARRNPMLVSPFRELKRSGTLATCPPWATGSHPTGRPRARPWCCGRVRPARRTRLPRRC